LKKQIPFSQKIAIPPRWRTLSPLSPIRVALSWNASYTFITMKHFPARHRILLPTFLLFTALLLSPGNAEDWKRVSSKDGKLSALFPTDIKENLQTQTDKTIAGKVTSYFGEYYGDGILLAGSGADIPLLARAAGDSAIYDGSKKTFLDEAQGTEISFKEITVSGVPARELIYEGAAYRGEGEPYQGRAYLIMVNKRLYVINSVITKPTPENKADEEKLLTSIEVSE
jgi:hypothetical protein